MDDDRTPESVFGLLADGTRVDILRAVAVAQHEQDGLNSGPAELAFSEIYDRVEVENTSKLSYHLGELAGTFLRKGDDGYSFTHAGERIVRFVLSGGYERPEEFTPTETDGTCPYCGETSLEAGTEHQYFRVECSECERPVAGYSVTPVQTRSRSGEQLVRAVGRRQAADYAQVRHGACPECAGPLATEVRAIPETPLPDADPFLAIDDCGECLRRYSAPLTYGVAYHPASVAFHWERGIDVTAKAMWEFHDHVYEDRWTAEQVATDPDEYEVVLRRGDDALRARLDSSATVVRTERVRRERAAERGE